MKLLKYILKGEFKMANKKYVSLSKLSAFLDKLREIFPEINHRHNFSDIDNYVIDSVLSSTSTNPVQNKVIDAEFEAMCTAMNALDIAIDAKADVEPITSEELIQIFDEIYQDA
jgi:cysteinyl-tRNA synthetase